MDLVERVRGIVGAAIVRVGLKVAGFDPISVEHERAFIGVSPEDEDGPPIAPVELSPRARAMVEEARIVPPRAVRELDEIGAELPRRGSIADRVARARAGG